MLLSRFFYLLLAAAVAAALAGVMLAKATFNRQYDADLRDQLRRDRLEIELWLKLDARARLDAIAPIAASDDVRDALRSSRGHGSVDKSVRKKLERKLRSFNQQLSEMRADIMFAVNSEGLIVGQLGGSPPPNGAGLGAFPLVSRAIAGYVRDDVWLYNGAAYRMAARPVIDRSQYVGAIVHGKKLDDDLASKLGERIQGASVMFFVRERPVASYMPQIAHAARGEEMAAPLPNVFEDAEFKESGKSDPVELGDRALAVYGLVTGAARDSGVGYALARPRTSLMSPFDIFDQASGEDVSNVNWPALIGLSVLLFALGMLFIYIERDRPLAKFREAVLKVADGKAERLNIGDHGAGFRKPAEGFNRALETVAQAVAQSAPRKAADLDAILGPTPGDAAAPSFFGFQDRGGGGPDEVPSIPAPPPPGGAVKASVPKSPAFRSVGAGAPPPTPPSLPKGKSPAAEPKAAAELKAAAPPLPEPRASAVSGNGPMAAATAGGPPPFVPGAVTSKGNTPLPGPSPTSAKVTPGGGTPSPIVTSPTPPKGNGRAPMKDFHGDPPEEEATAVTQVPEELLASAAGDESPADQDRRHFKEVFDEFVSAKKQCGEPTSGLTFDKFSATLRKNREQIIARHGAKSVRFSVYLKEGKAAIKATPLRDG